MFGIKTDKDWPDDDPNKANKEPQKTAWLIRKNIGTRLVPTTVFGATITDAKGEQYQIDFYQCLN